MPKKRSTLDWIEHIGNKLPEPALLFALLAVLVILVSGILSPSTTQSPNGTTHHSDGWQVQPMKLTVVTVDKLSADGSPELDASDNPIRTPQLDAKGKPLTRLEPTGDPIRVKNLMTGDGIYWMLSSMIRNFIMFPPLGLVLTGMLGIGVAEKVGLFSALMRWLAGITPKWLLTPMIILIGANSSIASDAGYLILPPLAAALFAAVGRHPLAGLAASFAGVAGGFGAGAFITGADTILAGVATQSSQILDAHYSVLPTCNWYFKILSVPVLMLIGWFVTDRIVEPRLMLACNGKIEIPSDAGVPTPGQFKLSATEVQGLLLAGLGLILVLGIFAFMILKPGMALFGDGQPTLPNGRLLVDVPASAIQDGATPKQISASAPERLGPRWSHVLVPAMFFAFLTPGLVYGFATRSLKSQADVVGALYSAIKGIVPVIVMNFFAAQFLAYFSYTNLDRMLAFAGGSMLVEANLPVPLLLVLFVAFIILADFAMSSMTAKFTLLAPILIPMFMMVGVSPALAMAGYRIGDSVVNIVSPLNAYLAIVLLVLQRYQKSAGLGSLIALMVPYSVTFGIMWTLFLLAWYMTGQNLGPQGPLHYVPGH